MNFKPIKFLGSQAPRLTLPCSHASNPEACGEIGGLMKNKSFYEKN
jgi:hypothetical protein